MTGFLFGGNGDSSPSPKSPAVGASRAPRGERDYFLSPASPFEGTSGDDVLFLFPLSLSLSASAPAPFSICGSVWSFPDCRSSPSEVTAVVDVSPRGWALCTRRTGSVLVDGREFGFVCCGFLSPLPCCLSNMGWCLWSTGFCQHALGHLPGSLCQQGRGAGNAVLFSQLSCFLRFHLCDIRASFYFLITLGVSISSIVQAPAVCCHEPAIAQRVTDALQHCMAPCTVLCTAHHHVRLQPGGHQARGLSHLLSTLLLSRSAEVAWLTSHLSSFRAT